MIKYTDFSRRTFLASVAAAAFVTSASSAARAAARVAPISDWRRPLGDAYLGVGRDFSVRYLQDGLEIWESGLRGYAVVDSNSRIMIESSAHAVSPFVSLSGDLVYGGPGAYYGARGNERINPLTGNRVSSADLRHYGADASAALRESLEVGSVVDGRVSTSSSGGGLVPVNSADIDYRISNYSYITGATLYNNTEGTCGWIAGSIVTRYWHARSSSRILLPSSYRNGTNMTASPNFATYLQGNSGNSSWARDVKDRLIWNANNQSVGHSAAWALSNIGVVNSLKANEPVICFGSIPTGPNKKGSHAVVAYGQTKDGSLITHYGWSGYTAIVLSSGVLGSNTKFRLG